MLLYRNKGNKVEGNELMHKVIMSRASDKRMHFLRKVNATGQNVTFQRLKIKKRYPLNLGHNK